MNKIKTFFSWLGNDIKDIGVTFKEGDFKTKLSFLIFGLGPILRKSVVKGIAYLAVEVFFFIYMIQFGWQYLSKINTLGTIEKGIDPETFLLTDGDNSFFILLYGILSIMFIIGFIAVWRMNIKENRKEELLLKAGKKVPTSIDDLKSLLDGNFHITLMALPIIGVFVFIVLPIIFMICVAFTNYDYNHQAPTKLFTWVGLENFKSLLSFGSSGFGSRFFTVLGWTLVWAFFATFLTYFLGMGVAMMINKKGIRFKAFWRTILVMTIAIPQFVSLLYVAKMFDKSGIVNTFLLNAGIIDKAIPFWTNIKYARMLIIGINCWVGIPYLMLITTGILMNIPEELYESAMIDGANAWQRFRKITLPYMLFVTGPYLLTQFTGNLNNFNVIYLLSCGEPTSAKLSGNAGYTDLLVTWLYKMTINQTNYKMAAVIGIMVFIVVSVVSLVVYNLLPSIKDEEGFQ